MYFKYVFQVLVFEILPSTADRHIKLGTQWVVWYVVWCVAVRAAHTFYSATTMLKVKTVDKFGVEVTRKIKTKMLCQTTDPEEKRIIIGDTFMNVYILIFIHLRLY